MGGDPGGGGVTSLQPRAGLALAPGERGGTVGQARDAAGVSLIAVVAHAALNTAGRQEKDKVVQSKACC